MRYTPACKNRTLFAGDEGQLVAARNPALAPVAWSDSQRHSKIAHPERCNQWALAGMLASFGELDKNNRYATPRSEVKIDFKGKSVQRSSHRYKPILTAYPNGNWRRRNRLPGLNLPEWEVSGWQLRGATKWAIHYSPPYTSWSQFRELKAGSTAGDTPLRSMKALQRRLSHC